MRIPLPWRQRGVAQRQRGERFKFFTDIISELKKVSWPTREEATRLTAMVIIISVAIGLLLGIIDYGFSELFMSGLLGR